MLDALLFSLIITAVYSAPPTRMAAQKGGSDRDKHPIWRKALLVPVAFAVWAFVLLPFSLMVVVADDIQRANPLMTNVKLRVFVMFACWLIVAFHYWYRAGYRDGVRGSPATFNPAPTAPPVR